MIFVIAACASRIDIDYLAKARQENTPTPDDLAHVTIHIENVESVTDVGILVGGKASGHICGGMIPNHPKARSVRLRNLFDHRFRTLNEHMTMTLLYTSKGEFYDIADTIGYEEPNRLYDSDKRDPMNLCDTD